MHGSQSPRRPQGAPCAALAKVEDRLHRNRFVPSQIWKFRFCHLNFNKNIYYAFPQCGSARIHCALPRRGRTRTFEFNIGSWYGWAANVPEGRRLHRPIATRLYEKLNYVGKVEYYEIRWFRLLLTRRREIQLGLNKRVAILSRSVRPFCRTAPDIPCMPQGLTGRKIRFGAKCPSVHPNLT